MKNAIQFIGTLCAFFGWNFVFAQEPLDPAPGAGNVVTPVNLEHPQAAAEEERLRRLDFFRAVAWNDLATIDRLLAAGIDPNADLPQPAPKDFLKAFTDRNLQYFLSSEHGVTALMLASALGNELLVRRLLDAGASPKKVTKRSKTFALWFAGKYGHLEIMRLLMRIDPSEEVRSLYLDVDLASQQATLFKGREVLLTMPISSGRKSHPTPQGWFIVTDKYENWVSTLYHARMPYFLRLSCSEVGLHQGVLPGYPASHGCVRLPPASARKLFSLVPLGTLVSID